MAKTKIFLDVGHGGKDSGALGHGIMEKDIVLKIAKKMDALLKNYSNIEVKLSRSSDVYLSLNERTQMANNWGADVLISLHINAAAAASAKGFESYRYTNTNAATTAFQNVLHQEIMKQLGSDISDRGKKQKNLHMLRESKMKACLTENLFISNAADAAKLKSDAFLDKVADGHVKGLEKFLGLKRIEKPPQDAQPNEPSPSKPKAEKLWIVQAGAFEEKKYADELSADLTRQGFRNFVKKEGNLFKIQCGAFEERSNADKLVKQLISEGFRAFAKYE